MLMCSHVCMCYVCVHAHTLCTCTWEGQRSVSGALLQEPSILLGGICSTDQARLADESVYISLLSAGVTTHAIMPDSLHGCLV